MDWYNNSLNTYGETDFRSLTWGSEDGGSARQRYEQMNDEISFKDNSIIEFGCGWGSFFDFGFTCKEYTGLDINTRFIQLASKKHQFINFIESDVLLYNTYKQFDLAISSGVAGNQGGPADHPTKLKQYLTLMINHANNVLVNFPSTWATIRSHNIEYFSPASTLEIALQVTNNVTLIHKSNKDFLLKLQR